MQSIPISIAQTLQQHILSGHYASGSHLPPQRELARQLGISRASLREALSMLETLGLVDIQPGKGVRINGPRGGSARMPRAYATPALGTLSPRQLIELRLVLEPGWSALAAARADDAGLRQLQWTQGQLAHALERNDLLAAAEADLQFHLLLAQLSGNPGLVAMARELEHAISHSLRLPFAWSGADDKPAREHEAIAQAVCAGDASAAACAMRAHLLSAAQRSGIDLDAPAADDPVSFCLTPSSQGAFA
ncbi:FadR/GntR family transcriptional regulator [Delftia sp. PS-11]|uniref:FadR/GntR family transcriptional regulator n=1 Tax=Delftia sp. PS-11 TaxID=2767222 RepID=UPI0024579635|nr:FCD domain-containing protein [Delftia sp. PS-11]KAJ8745744.1 FadR family transcriptional regulator [Delftia sp. PS-11]